MRPQPGATEQLQRLFREAGSAHHKAFISTNGDDPEWPMWYAEILVNPLNTCLGTNLTKSELVYHLVKVEKDRSQDRSGTDWPAYYTQYFKTLSPGMKSSFTKNIHR